MNEENDSSQLIKRIEELEAIVTGKDIVESAGWWGRFSAYQFNQRKAVEAERDQLAAENKRLDADNAKAWNQRPAKADAKPHAQFLWNRRERGLDAILAHRIAPDTDHCPSCGEYLHDEMGHMCPPHNAALKERDRAVADVLRERSFQDKQWGGPEHDDTHSWHDWIRYIQYQVSKGCIPTRRREGLVKIAALAIAGIESHDRKFRIEFGLKGK